MVKTTIQVSNQMIVFTNTWENGAKRIRQLEIRPGVEIPLEGFEELLLEVKYEALHIRNGMLPPNTINYDNNLSS